MEKFIKADLRQKKTIKQLQEAGFEGDVGGVDAEEQLRNRAMHNLR